MTKTAQFTITKTVFNIFEK